MLKGVYSIIFLFFTTICCAAPFMRTNFEEKETGLPYLRKDWSADGFQPDDWDEGLETRTTISDEFAARGLHSLRVMYPKGEFGTANTGCQVPLLFDSRDEAYISYFLRFSNNFSWGTTSYGGKLPGLSGGDNCSGGKMCDGNGWSARFMWRAGGKLVLYLYDMLKPDVYGEDHTLTYPDGNPVVAQRGRWYHITERVKMNSTADDSDGEVQVWVDGVEVLYLKGRKFTTSDVKIDNLYISTFHGGSNDTWCPTDTCYTYFDDIRIGDTYEDVKYQECGKPNLGPDQTLCGDGLAHFDVKSDDNVVLDWYCNGKKIASGNVLQTNVPGTYICVANKDLCFNNDTVIVSNTLDFSVPESLYICNTSFINIDSHILAKEGLSFEWKKDNEVIDNCDKPYLTTKDAGIYSLSISSDNCKTVSHSTTVSSGLLKIGDVTGVAGQVVEVNTNNNGNYIWTDANGSILSTNNELQIELPLGSEYIYVRDADGFSGSIGKKKISSNAWTRSNFETEWMVFQVERNLTVDSISIYPTKTLDATINIVDESTGKTIFSQTYLDLDGGEEARLAIGVELTPGTYRMDAKGTTAPIYYSHTDSDISFPYTIDGLITLQGCNLAWINNKGWYMYFYDWHISAGNHCAATPVKIEGNISNSAIVLMADNLTITQSDNALIIDGLNGKRKICITNTAGISKCYDSHGEDRLILSTSGWSKGIYFVEGKSVIVR